MYVTMEKKYVTNSVSSQLWVEQKCNWQTVLFAFTLSVKWFQQSVHFQFTLNAKWKCLLFTFWPTSRKFCLALYKVSKYLNILILVCFKGVWVHLVCSHINHCSDPRNKPHLLWQNKWYRCFKILILQHWRHFRIPPVFSGIYCVRQS